MGMYHDDDSQEVQGSLKTQTKGNKTSMEEKSDIPQSSALLPQIKEINGNYVAELMMNDLMMSSKIAKKNYREIVTPQKKSAQPVSVLLPNLVVWKGGSSTSMSALENATPNKS